MASSYRPGSVALDALEVGVELRDVAAELLAQRERHRVLQVGAADLDDVGELRGLARSSASRSARTAGSRSRTIAVGRGDVHRGRERVVGGLRHVHVVVGVDRRLRAELAARHLDGAVGDDLVDVHVGLGARAGLPDVQREVVVERAGDHLVGRRDDQVGDGRVE